MYSDKMKLVDRQQMQTVLHPSVRMCVCVFACVCSHVYIYVTDKLNYVFFKQVVKNWRNLTWQQISLVNSPVLKP